MQRGGAFLEEQIDFMSLVLMALFAGLAFVLFQIAGPTICVIRLARVIEKCHTLSMQFNFGSRL
jgi:hypothetical protein